MGSGLDAAKGIWVSRSPNRLGFFKISQRGGRKKKDRKKKKRNERGGTGLSAPEASASATSAASPASARPPRAQNPNFALCLGQHGVPTDPVRMALHSISSPASIPCQLCPGAGSSDVARQHSWCQSRCAAAGAHLPWSWHWGRPALLAGLPCTPFPSPVPASGQTHEGCAPREELWAPRLRAPSPVPQDVEHHLPVILDHKDPLGSHLHTAQHPHCSGSRDLMCQRGEGWWNCPLQGDIPPHLPASGLAEKGIRTYSCWRGGFQRCLVRLSAS